jgi:hypothetical protein
MYIYRRIEKKDAPVNVKQTPRRAPISESLAAVELTMAGRTLASVFKIEMLDWVVSKRRMPEISYMRQKKIHTEWRIPLYPERLLWRGYKRLRGMPSIRTVL